MLENWRTSPAWFDCKTSMLEQIEIISTNTLTIGTKHMSQWSNYMSILFHDVELSKEINATWVIFAKETWGMITKTPLGATQFICSKCSPTCATSCQSSHPHSWNIDDNGKLCRRVCHIKGNLTSIVSLLKSMFPTCASYLAYDRYKI